MAKKLYEKPTTKVVMLQQRAQLLAGSDSVNATMNGVWSEEDV